MQRPQMVETPFLDMWGSEKRTTTVPVRSTLSYFCGALLSSLTDGDSHRLTACSHLSWWRESVALSYVLQGARHSRPLALPFREKHEEM